MDIGHKKTSKELERLEKELVRIYKRTLKELEKELRAKYKEQDKLDTQEVRRAIAKLEDTIKRCSIEMQHTNILAHEMLQGTLERVVDINDEWSYNHILKELEKHDLDITYNMLNTDTIKEIVRGDSFKELALEAFTDEKRIYRELKRSMAQSIILGEPTDKMAKRFQKIMGNELWEATRIARTETTKAQNTARDASFRDAINQGINLKKEWVSATDDRTRKSHRKLDGEVVDYDKEFSNGCIFPSVGGSASEVINCRCTFIAIMEDY